MTPQYRELMAQAWAATGHQRYRDIAVAVGMAHATVHRLLTGSTTADRSKVLFLLRYAYGSNAHEVIAQTMAAHDEARRRRLETARRAFRLRG